MEGRGEDTMRHDRDAQRLVLEARGPKMLAAPLEVGSPRRWDAKKVPIVVMAYSHDTTHDVMRTLDSLMRLGKADQHEIIISQVPSTSSMPLPCLAFSLHPLPTQPTPPQHAHTHAHTHLSIL